MQGASAGGEGAGPTRLSRRRLLGLAGAATVAVAGGCSSSPGGAQLVPVEPIEPAGPRRTVVAAPEPVPPVAEPTDAGMLCRESWRAQPARPGGVAHTPSKMTIHHSAVVLGDNGNITDRLRQHQHYHQDQHHWIDIAYHVSVDRNGNIFELRDPNLVGDTATNYDPAGHFLVLCEGNFDEESVTEEMLQAAATAFAWAVQRFGISTDTLGGHRDHADTSCPGDNLYRVVASGELKRRVDDLVAGGPVHLRRICEDEAADIVARIEAGQ